MTSHQIPFSSLRNCLQYHKAVLARRQAIRKAWRVECGFESAAGLSDSVLSGLMAMADCIAFNHCHKILSEPDHGQA